MLMFVETVLVPVMFSEDSMKHGSLIYKIVLV